MISSVFLFISAKPSTYRLTKESEDCYIFDEYNKSYESIKQLVMDFSRPDGPVQLLECLPPSEYGSYSYFMLLIF